MAKLGRHEFQMRAERGWCVGCKVMVDPVYLAPMKTRGMLQHKVHPKFSRWCATCVYKWGVVAA